MRHVVCCIIRGVGRRRAPSRISVKIRDDELMSRGRRPGPDRIHVRTPMVDALFRRDASKRS